MISTSKMLSSALQFFVALGLMGLGGFFLLLFYIPRLKIAFCHALANHPGIFSLCGSVSFGLGMGLFIAFYVMNRGVYYQVKMSENAQMSIDPEIIRQYASQYWKQQFPLEAIDVDVLIHSGSKIELIAESGALSHELQEELLEKTERELSAILAQKIGYRRELLITVVMK
jgi:hypothetical protein